MNGTHSKTTELLLLNARREDFFREGRRRIPF